MILGAAKGRGSARIVLWSMTLANAMILIDQTAVPLALPNVMQDFASGLSRCNGCLTRAFSR